MENGAGPVVLVLGTRAPVGVIVARALARAGFEVHAAESLTPNFGETCRAISRTHAIPPPRQEPDAFADALSRLCETHAISAIVPCNEETFWLAAARETLPPDVRVFCPPLATLLRLHHKGDAIAFAKSLGITVPETRSEPDFSRDGVMKRAFSRFSSHVVPLRGTESERRRAFRTIDGTDGADWVWQEWVDGPQICSYSVCSRGEILAHAAYATPFTAGLGAGIAYESVSGRPFERTFAMAKILARTTNYTGQLSLDTIDSGDSRGCVLIEVNPRATMGAALLAGSTGFPGALKSAIFGDGPGKSLVRPLDSALRQLRLAMLGEVARRPRYAAIRTFLTWPDVLDDKTDPAPGRSALRIWLAYARAARRQGLPPRAFLTHDIEWNANDTSP